MAVQRGDAAVKNGTLVYILEQIEVFKNGESQKIIRRIPGRVQSKAEDEDDSFMVEYYGPPHHWSKSGGDYGIYVEKFLRTELAERDANREDPMELI